MLYRSIIRLDCFYSFSFGVSGDFFFHTHRSSCIKFWRQRNRWIETGKVDSSWKPNDISTIIPLSPVIHRSSINRPEKKTSISSISSNIPLTASSSDQDTTRSSKPADVQTFLDSMKMTSSKIVQDSMMRNENFIVIAFVMKLDSDSKRGRPTCPPKGAVPYTVSHHFDYDNLR